MATTAASRQKTFTHGTIPAAIAVSVAKATENATVSKPAGYGLPCANCHLYYPADLDTCPTCHQRGRVSPMIKSAPLKRGESLPAVPDSAAVEQEREEFLRQFKSQSLQTEAASGNGSLCAFSERHDGEEASAEVCKTCYEHLHQRIDGFEAALAMNIKEAAQVIYDAVWADPSDPSKTYENAAAALLNELRTRAGVNPPSGSFEPLSD